MDADDMGDDLERVLHDEKEIQTRIAELAAEIDADYAGRDLLLVGVLKGAVMVMADLARALHVARSDGLDGRVVVRLGHQELRRRADPQGPRRRHQRAQRPRRRGHHRLRAHAVLAAAQPDVSRAPPRSRSSPCCASRRPPRSTCPVRYVGFDIANEFVVGYGLDYAQRYRNLPFVGTLAPHVYA